MVEVPDLILSNITFYYWIFKPGSACTDMGLLELEVQFIRIGKFADAKQHLTFSFNCKITRRLQSGAQSGSRIYQSRQTLSESKFAKIQISHFRGGGGNLFPTFVAESKLAKIQISHFGGGSLKPISNFCC